jgi:thiamine pyrophosphate-dependent acetolactate synthase large subunit-like protein
MTSRKDSEDLGRRRFLSGVALAGATAALPAAASVSPAAPASSSASPPLPEASPALRPGAAALAAEQGEPRVLPGTLDGRPGSDYMVDVLKALGIEYVASNPGSSFRGLQESIATYGGNAAPEFLTCLHEETSAAMAHGYAKIALQPMAFLAHGTVGLQHAAMAVYNAWCDRVPLIGILGNGLNAEKRRPGVEWQHTAQDPCEVVRDYVKWDDQPTSLRAFGESLTRAWKLTMTPPMEPVMIVADSELQEEGFHAAEWPAIPRLVKPNPPAGEPGAVREAAKWLVEAELPLIVADRAARTPAGVARLIELAELLGAPVVDQGGRMNFPTTHPLSLSERGGALVRRADVILGLELTDFWGTVNEYVDNLAREHGPRTRDGARLVAISANELYLKSNYQDFQRYPELDLAIAGDAEATLPTLIEACRALIDPRRARAIAARREAMAQLRAEARAAALEAATAGWDASPISTARLAAEVWQAIKGEDWSLVSPDNFISGWARRLWPFERHYQYIGHAGGAGVGYGLPAAVGAALANRPHGRLSLSIQPDGDLMYAPGAIWTAVHHKIPLLSVMHNNRAYHQEIMHLQRMANRRQRGVDRAWIGTTIDDPPIDYAMLAKSMGMWAEGPITNPRDLGPALRRAVAVVKSGRPALLDVVTQPR